MARVRLGQSAVAGGGIACAIALTVLTPNLALAGDIKYRSFSPAAAIGPPAEAFAAKLQSLTQAVLGATGEVRFVKLPGVPSIPTQFSGDIVSAVAAGSEAGGFDAAYTAGSELNKTWGFIYNSGVPFGPTFEEFLGFLYGKSIDNGQRTGLDLVQDLLDKRHNVIAIPIVGSSEQLSGYFFEPMDDVRGHRGIGLTGLCEQHWTLRYLPPAENVLNLACDDLVSNGKIRRKYLNFAAAVPGGGSLVDGVMNGALDGFEFATPLDDVSQLFTGPSNPGTAGVRFVHAPGWHQQFLITWMLINRSVWNSMSSAQKLLVQTVARDHVISSYGENLRQQGAALQTILNANKNDGDPDNDMVLSQWSLRDQIRLRDATIRFLNARADDASLPADDRADYVKILESLRQYVHGNDTYWDHRQVNTSLRFEDWANRLGQCWGSRCEPQRCLPGRRPD